MVINLILIPSKLIDFPKKADLWRNFYYATLLNSHFCMSKLCKFSAFLQNTFSEQHLWNAASGHLHNNKTQGKQRYTG